MDILVQWHDGERWVDDSQFSSVIQAVVYAAEAGMTTLWGSHRVTVDGKLYATFEPRGEQ